MYRYVDGDLHSYMQQDPGALLQQGQMVQNGNDRTSLWVYWDQSFLSELANISAFTCPSVIFPY